jgi:predicted glycogen debranching enzyme
LLDGNRYELGTNDYGDVIFPKGFIYLSSFRKDFFPEWIYEVAGIRIRKTITMVKDENTTLIRYEILKSEKKFTLELRPLIAARGYHQLQHSQTNIFWNVDFHKGLFRNQPFEGAPNIYISVPGSSWQPVLKWYYKFNYLQEKYRGLDFEEDLFNHGFFSVELKDGDALDIMISTEDPSGKTQRHYLKLKRTENVSY